MLHFSAFGRTDVLNICLKAILNALNYFIHFYATDFLSDIIFKNTKIISYNYP